MEYSALLNAHKGIIYLFLAFITIKVVLMMVNNDLFQVVRAKTKVVDMILGALVLASGVWLFIESPATSQAWLHTKITLGLLGIPLAIIGFKKKNIPLAVGALVLFAYVFYIGISKGLV
jgi:uncharacterized membrane protein SirB2